MGEKTIRLAYYGDDFTGSTDAMEALTLSGLRTVLFLGMPTLEMLEREFAGIQAFGIAGISRALSPEQMEKELPQIFRLMADSGAAVCHYKTCSTFDSSPEIGSIGKAIELARGIFTGQRYVPLIVGVPALGRYTVFGQHFAALQGKTYRLDRHPIMSRHPVTPMDEADLLGHLAAQTKLNSSLVNILELSGPPDSFDAAVERKLEEEKPAILLFDVLDEERLAKTGRLIWQEASRSSLFAAGSSGVEYALTAFWQAAGLADKRRGFPELEAPGPMLVVSGSCSSMTQLQIEGALASGFAGIQVDPAEWITMGNEAEPVSRSIVEQAVKLLDKGTSVIVYTAKGPDDESIVRTKSGFAAAGSRNGRITGERIGEQLGLICRSVLARKRLKRIVVAGGDTSGFVMKQLDIYAMEMVAPLAPGVPLCRAYSRDPQFSGLELALKGGQMGGEDFFLLAGGGRMQTGEGK